MNMNQMNPMNMSMNNTMMEKKKFEYTKENINQ